MGCPVVFKCHLFPRFELTMARPQLTIGCPKARSQSFQLWQLENLFTFLNVWNNNNNNNDDDDNNSYILSIINVNWIEFSLFLLVKFGGCLIHLFPCIWILVVSIGLSHDWGMQLTLIIPKTSLNEPNIQINRRRYNWPSWRRWEIKIMDLKHKTTFLWVPYHDFPPHFEDLAEPDPFQHMPTWFPFQPPIMQSLITEVSSEINMVIHFRDVFTFSASSRAVIWSESTAAASSASFFCRSAWARTLYEENSLSRRFICKKKKKSHQANYDFK